ncbi:LysM peptidoglycan-binding domain-containing protein [Kiritimatiellota bacterium B12222]|nr:LysM peptidoglycan-binding domain-containing protein [Kiritimatiellota bacterium B12222]
MNFPAVRSHFLLLFALLCFGSSGCTRYQGSDLTEKEHPKLIEAHERVTLQDLDGAEEILLTFLYDHPDYALTHLRLGMLYQSKREPIKAVYHFQRYLDARPESEKADIIRQVVDDESRRLGAMGMQQHAPLLDGSPEAQLQSLQQQLSDTQQKLAVAEVNLQQLRVRRGEVPFQAPPDWAVEKLALLEEISALKSKSATSYANPGQASVTTNDVPVENNVKTYTVKRGDTLGRISQKMYGEASRWRTIYDANRDVIPNQNALKLGTVLVIP